VLRESDGGAIFHGPLHCNDGRDLAPDQRRREPGPGPQGGLAGIQYDEVYPVATQEARRIRCRKGRQSPPFVLQKQQPARLLAVEAGMPDIMHHVWRVFDQCAVQPILGHVLQEDGLQAQIVRQPGKGFLDHSELPAPIELSLLARRGRHSEQLQARPVPQGWRRGVEAYVAHYGHHGIKDEELAPARVVEQLPRQAGQFPGVDVQTQAQPAVPLARYLVRLVPERQTLLRERADRHLAAKAHGQILGQRRQAGHGIDVHFQPEGVAGSFSGGGLEHLSNALACGRVPFAESQVKTEIVHEDLAPVGIDTSDGL